MESRDEAIETSNSVSGQSSSNLESSAGEETSTTFGNVSAYSSLVGQVGSIQGDLSKTVVLCQRLRSENVSLRESYEKLKAQHVKLHESYILVREQATHESSTRLTLEKRHDELVQKWRSQLEHKAEEFAKVEAKASPERDVEVLRLELRSELKKEHAEALLILEDQAEKYRAMYYEVRRQHELLKTEFEQFTIHKSNEISALCEGHSAAVAQLRIKISKIENELEVALASSNNRATQVRMEETKAERDVLFDEVGSLRERLSRNTMQLNSEKAKSEQQVVSLRKKTLEVEAAFAGKDLKIESLERSLKKFEEEKVELRQCITSQEANNQKLKHELIENEKGAKARQNELAREMSSSSANYSKEKHDLLYKISIAERQIRASQSAHEDKLKTLQVEMKREIEAKSYQVKQSEKSQRDVEERLKQKEQELEEFILKHQTLEREEVEAKDRLRNQIETQDAEVKRLRNEKQILHTKVQQQQQEVNQHLNKGETIETRQAELEREYGNLQEKHRETLVAVQALQTSKEFFETNMQYLEGELESARKNEKLLRAQHITILEENGTIKADAEEKENILISSMAVKLEQGKSTALGKTLKYKKKHELYKSALSQCKKRISDLKKRNLQLENEALTQDQLHHVEIESTKRRIRELERDQEVRQRDRIMSVTRFPGLDDENLKHEQKIHTVRENVESLEVEE